jgi:uncharacterized protein YegP (UPF0339 family)
MSAHPAWRGERRIRVAIEIGTRASRVVGLWLLDGPAVQRPTLEGMYVAQVMLGAATVLLQSLDDPLLIRGSSQPRIAGHSYTRTVRAVVHVDVPIPARTPFEPISIKIVDLSKVRQRPIDPRDMQTFLGAARRGVRTVAAVTAADLSAHADWASAGLPGGAALSPSGYYEIFIDRGRKYRWRFRRPDGRVVAESAQGYPRRADCEADLLWTREHGSEAPIRSLDIK